MQTSAIASNIPRHPSFIHDVELQYVDDEDVDPFQVGLIVDYQISKVFNDETLIFVFTIIHFI